LNIYAFALNCTGDRTRYNSYHGLTDAAGRITLTLPQGSYRFRRFHEPA
jgi:hypothetical protein